jgi:hypothetical protein
MKKVGRQIAEVGTLDFDHQLKQSTKGIGCAMTATLVQLSAEQN